MNIATLVSGAILMLPGIVVNVAHATTAAYRRDVPETLLAEAKVPEVAACEAALGHVKGGTIVALELEREDGILLYSIDVRVPGKSGIEEVHVSAMDGRVLLVRHESARDERAEAAADKKRLGH